MCLVCLICLVRRVFPENRQVARVRDTSSITSCSCSLAMFSGRRDLFGFMSTSTMTYNLDQATNTITLCPQVKAIVSKMHHTLITDHFLPRNRVAVNTASRMRVAHANSDHCL